MKRAPEGVEGANWGWRVRGRRERGNGEVAKDNFFSDFAVVVVSTLPPVVS